MLIIIKLSFSIIIIIIINKLIGCYFNKKKEKDKL